MRCDGDAAPTAASNIALSISRGSIDMELPPRVTRQDYVLRQGAWRRTDFQTYQSLAARSASQTASVTCLVVAFPPRSGVRNFGSAVTRSTAFINRSAARFSPRCSNIIDAVQNVATGLATPLPVMSKAEPWIGSNIDGASRSGLILAVGAMPSDPAKAAARSERMSA